MTRSVLGFDVGRELSRTPRALVFHGRDPAGDRPVIIKVLREHHAAPERVARFRREYDLLVGLKGLAGIPEARAFGRDGEQWAIVVDDAGGASLDALTAEQKLPIAEVLHAIAGAAAALAPVHERGLVHHDLSPSNIVLNRSTGVVQVIDFGSASLLDHEDTGFEAPTAHEGTLAYIAPEQTGRMNRGVDFRSDLYSLGATLYQLLVGAPPFTTLDPMELVHAHLAVLPVPPSERNEAVPYVVSAITLRLLAKDAEDRYPSAASLSDDLLECLRQLRATGEIAPFELARDRRPVRFVLPQRLYGRESEVRVLNEALARVGLGGEELLLLAGYSGVGKTALVQELFRPLTERRGFFVAGKFDQLQRDQPYAPVVDAFRSLCRQLLGESEAHLVAWRERLREALGTLGGVMAEVIPELGLLMDPQPDVSTLPASEALVRFERLFGRLVEAFAQPEHPLVLFLDDLQWADPGSLRLLENVLLRPDGHHLLVIGAYRENEVAAGHPLLLARDRLVRRGAAVHAITLQPLGPDVVHQFVADTVYATPAVAKPLADVVLAKTQGNPFFMRAFLAALHRDGLLRAADGWTWDLDAIRARDITDNVVDLMTAHLRTLPSGCIDVLRTAGALGGRFELRALAAACGLPVTTTWRRLWPAVAQGLVLALDDTYRLLRTDGDDDSAEEHALAESLALTLRFAHDRIQEAAYALVDPEHRAALHWHIGNGMRGRWLADGRPRQLFDMVGHLNAGRACATEVVERDALAAFNLAAARRAKGSAAFVAAHEYASIGLDLLGPDRFARQYAMAVELTGDAAETAFQTGDFARMDALFADGVAHAHTPVDAAWLHEIRTEALNAQGRPLDALNHALDYLDALGVQCPRAPAIEDVVAALGATEAALVGRTFDDLAAMSDIADPAIRVAVTLICKVYSSAYVASPLVFAALTLRQTQLVVHHGNCSVSALVYAVYGLLQAGLAGNVERGYDFGRLGNRMIDRPDSARYRAQALHLFNCHTRFWREHVRNGADGERDAWRAGLETGEVESGSYGGHVASKYAFFHGQELPGLAAEMQHYTLAMQRTRSDIALHSHVPWHQAALNLLNPVDEPWELRGPVCNADELRPLLVQQNDRMSLSNASTARLILAVIFGRFAEGIVLAREGATLLDSVLSQFNQPVHHFFASLARLGACEGLNDEERAKELAEVQASLTQLRRWSQAAPVNFAQKVSLLEAELSRVNGDTRDARDRYDEAIALAQQNEFGLDEAIACETAGRFLLSVGQMLPARHYLRDARDAYNRWGAHTKTADLESRYPELLPVATYDTLSTTHTSASTRALGTTFDVHSVIRASQAISREVHLPDLLRSLAAAMMENAGAERAVLVLERDGRLTIEADARAGQPLTDILRSIPVTTETAATSLPESVLKYAVRSREVVVLEDARTSRQFASDPYIRSVGPRSVLCQPIVGGGQVKGVIYLENNLASGAFNAARADVVGLLSGQMAIAIDNARHYATLEERVRERTAQIESRNRFIRQVFGRYLSDGVVDALLASDRGVEIGGERRVVTVMFTDLRGFTAVCEQFPPEQVTRMLNNYLEVMTRHIHHHQGTIDDILGDGMLVLFGAPLFLDDHAGLAVACALEMQRAMREVNAWNVAHDLPTVSMGIGINTGEVIVGNIGSEQRAKYGAVGRNVNLGARIESITAAGQVLISEATRDAIAHPLRIDGERSFTPKGSTQVLRVFDVGGIGGAFDISLDRRSLLRTLPGPIPVYVQLVDGKELRAERYVAAIVAASGDALELESTEALAASSGIVIDLVLGGRREDIHGRVVPAANGRFLVQLDRFSLALGALAERASEMSLG